MSGEETINAALSFVEHVYKVGSPFNGTVRFHIQDDAEGISYVKYIRVTAGSGMHTYDDSSYDGAPVDCKVHVDRVILLAILTGSLDPAIALMCGQLSVDNIVVMSEFVRAFDLTENNFTNFQLSLLSAAEREGTLDDGATIVTHYNIETPQLDNNNKKMPLKQTLAIQALHMLATCKNIGSDIDGLITKVKEKDNVKKALEDLDAKVEEFQTTPTYKNLQSNSIFVTLRTELERASISAAVVGNKAKGVGAELVDKLMAVAYPPNEDAIRATVMSITVGPEDVHICVEGEPNANVSAVKDELLVPANNNKPRKASKEEVREQKRVQLLEKLEKLKQHNKEQSEQRAQRIAACTSSNKYVSE